MGRTQRDGTCHDGRSLLPEPWPSRCRQEVADDAGFALEIVHPEKVRAMVSAPASPASRPPVQGTGQSTLGARPSSHRAALQVGTTANCLWTAGSSVSAWDTANGASLGLPVSK